MVDGWAYGVLAAFVFMVLCNGLASAGLLGGKTNKQISDENPTYLSPDGQTFAIWGIIYTLELVLVIAQLFPSESAEALLQRESPMGLDVRQQMVLAFVINGVWLPVFNNEYFWSSWVIIVVYLGFLLSIYTDVNTQTTEGLLEYLCYAAGITLNCSWVVVATCVSTFLNLGRVGWKDQNGVAGSVVAASVVIVLVALLACQRALVVYDLVWAFGASWALMGIYHMQTVPDKVSLAQDENVELGARADVDAVRFPPSAMNANLGNLARGCSYLVIVAMVAGAALALFWK